MIPSEHQEQASVIAEAALRARTNRAWGLLLAIPNGGLRSKAVAAKLKAEGVRPGVPDLFLPVARGREHGLWIEMKRTKGGHISPEQEAWAEALEAQGYRVRICRGADAAIREIRDYLGQAVARDVEKA